MRKSQGGGGFSAFFFFWGGGVVSLFTSHFHSQKKMGTPGKQYYMT